MTEGPSGLAELAHRLASGQAPPPDAQVLKQSPIRTVVRRGELVLKVLRRRPKKAVREAWTLRRAAGRGIPVPELLGAGTGWVATRFAPGRPATRDDLPEILRVVKTMHARGMLHRDLHLGNLRIGPEGPLLLDTQKARFLPRLLRLPGWLRRWELGYLAFSLGPPLPSELEDVRRWRDRRARTHWRSRTARCLVESSGFTAVECHGESGFRRRDVPADALCEALAPDSQHERIKQTPRSGLYRSGAWIVKRHASPAAARAAWVGTFGLEVRGIDVARPLAWIGRHLVLEDAGPTLIDWVESSFDTAPEPARDELAQGLAGLLSRLHASAIYHPDLKANNVCWTPDAPPRLIDCGGVRFGRRLSERRRVKNLAQLNAALPDCVPGPLRERALQLYAERTGRAEAVAPLRKRVVAESLRRSHRWSGC